MNLDYTPEELAFYDAVAANDEALYERTFLRDLIHDVVQASRRNLRVDWTQPNSEDLKAVVRAAVKRVLRNRGVRAEDFDQFVDRFMTQAVALFAD